MREYTVSRILYNYKNNVKCLHVLLWNNLYQMKKQVFRIEYPIFKINKQMNNNICICFMYMSIYMFEYDFCFKKSKRLLPKF